MRAGPAIDGNDVFPLASIFAVGKGARKGLVYSLGVKRLSRGARIVKTQSELVARTLLSTKSRTQVEEDRKPLIEAAIVRILKARRVLDHNSIITEVTRQLSARFSPTPAVIKKRIESLIDREFLERDPNDRRLYRYMA